jgi:hypothetical protein
MSISQIDQQVQDLMEFYMGSEGITHAVQQMGVNCFDEQVAELSGEFPELTQDQLRDSMRRIAANHGTAR